MTVLMVESPLEAASPTLGSLEQAVDGFEKPIRLTRLRPRHDAFEMTAHEAGDLLHGIDLAAHDADTPVLEHRANHVDLPALQDLAQPFLVDPGSCGSHAGLPGDERIEVGHRLGLEARAVLEQRPAHALERLVATLLDAAHLVDGSVGVPDDVELIERDAGVGRAPRSPP